MIQVSQKKLRNDGILFYCRGWISFINYFFLEYLTSVCITTHQIMQVVRPLRMILPVLGIVQIVRPLRVILPLLGFIFTLYYIVKQRKRFRLILEYHYRYVWFSLFGCMVLINLIQLNVNHNNKFPITTSHFYGFDRICHNRDWWYIAL